jgi:iron-sulfur cluster repair protein YtfE (RIC family)
MKKKIDILTELVAYHEAIESLHAEFQSLIRSLRSSSAQEVYESFRKILRTHFEEHFKFEETIIFPAINAYYRDKKHLSLIQTYKTLHSELLSSGWKFLARLKDSTALSESAAVNESIKYLTDLYGRIVLHAKHENETIVPIVRDNTTIRFLSARNMLALKSLAATPPPAATIAPAKPPAQSSQAQSPPEQPQASPPA